MGCRLNFIWRQKLCAQSKDRTHSFLDCYRFMAV